MSYDLHVFTATLPEIIDRQFALRGTTARIVGDVSSGAFSVEREMRAGSTHAFTVDGPLQVEQEDLPDPVVAAAAGLRWMYELSLDGAARPSVELARHFAQELAQPGPGVVYDPQEGAIVWPRGSRRVRLKPAPTIDIIQFQWFVRREDMPSDLAAALFDLVRAYLPEALPRRFGGFEPLQGRLEERGRDGFINAWQAEAIMLFWKGVSPFLGGSMTGLGDESAWAAQGEAHPVGGIHLSFDRRAFLDEFWREDVVRMFTAMAERLHAFFGVAELEQNIGYSRGNLQYGAAALTNPGLVARSVWMGLPDFPIWLAWFGNLYRPFVEPAVAPDIAESRTTGLLVRTSLTPASPGPRPLLLPARLVLRAAREGPLAWRTERADFVPPEL